MNIVSVRYVTPFRVRPVGLRFHGINIGLTA